MGLGHNNTKWWENARDMLWLIVWIPCMLAILILDSIKKLFKPKG